MPTSKVRVTALLVAAGLLAALGSALAAEGDDEDDPVAVTPGDEQLVDSLLALQDDLPGLVPSAADFASNDLDPVLNGSFTSARSTLDRMEDDIRQLYIDSDEAGTAVGDAVSSVARGLLLERQAFVVLQDADGSTNPRPLDSSNARTDDDIAIDADGLLGLETTGVDLLLQARDLQLAGYGVLAAADPVFEGELETRRTYQDTVGVTLDLITSDSGEELLVPAARYDAPLGVARASTVTYVCVDRADYLELSDMPQAERVAAAAVAQPGQACIDTARRAGLALEDQESFVDASDIPG